MKKCPSCYAIMKETEVPIRIPKVQQRSATSASSMPEHRVRYECSQCGHVEESFAKPVAR